MSASPLLNPCTLLPACPLPPVKVTLTSSPATSRLRMPILIVPPGILRETNRVSTPPHPLLIWEGRGEGLEWPRYTLGPRTLYPRVWHPPVVIMRPRHPLPPSLLVPTAIPAPGRVTKPRSKDLRYNGKSSWKAFLHKFVRLVRSEQWTEVEQHDQLFFAL